MYIEGKLKLLNEVSHFHPRHVSVQVLEKIATRELKAKLRFQSCVIPGTSIVILEKELTEHRLCLVETP